MTTQQQVPFASSAETWARPVPDRDSPTDAVTGSWLPELLAQQAEHRLRGLGWPTRWRLLWARHDVRRRRADQTYEKSRRPERGLPVADRSSVGAFLRRLLAPRRRLFATLVVANLLAAAVGLVTPRLLGEIVDRAAAGVTALDGLAAVVLVVVIVQALLTLVARWVAAVFGQDVLAAAREHIVRVVLDLPLSRLEQASSGDLVTRITRDVGTMSRAARDVVPSFLLNTAFTVLTVGAMLLTSWRLTLPTLTASLGLALLMRFYLRRSARGYIAEGATYSRINSTMTETVTGARTVEALRLGAHRVAATAGDLEASAQAERYTMTLRNLLFCGFDLLCQAPLAGIVLLGTVGHAAGWATLGQVTAVALYSQQLVNPIDRLMQTLDHFQVAVASTTRLLGIAEVAPDRTPGTATPTGTDLVGDDLRFAYREGHDVLHGVGLRLHQGERLAIVGPSGSGKSTLGRLLAGINAPRTGSVTIGGVPAVELPLDLLRTEVALVTQEHHIFVGTIRENVVLARQDASDADALGALLAVDADWVERQQHGLDTMIGSGGTHLTPAQAQQIALARLVLADPHTLVLDEATSLIDPRTARHLEGSMHALLAGRTVVAIAHRLHTAHDADRIAVVIDGRIAELGSHDELLAAGGAYATLWRAWRS